MATRHPNGDTHKHFVDTRLLEKKRKPKKIPGKGRFFILTPTGTELAHFEEFSGPGGAKQYLDALTEDLPNGTELVRREDGTVLAYVNKTVKGWT